MQDFMSLRALVPMQTVDICPRNLMLCKAERPVGGCAVPKAGDRRLCWKLSRPRNLCPIARASSSSNLSISPNPKPDTCIQSQESGDVRAKPETESGMMKSLDFGFRVDPSDRICRI